VTRYALSLPQDLKREAEVLADRQGVSLNQFILWSVAEKVASLRQGVDDPDYPGITYRRGAAGQPTPVLRGTGMRVQTIAVAQANWRMAPDQIATELDIPAARVREALAFYDDHRVEIDASIQADAHLESQHTPQPGKKQHGQTAIAPGR